MNENIDQPHEGIKESIYLQANKKHSEETKPGYFLILDF